MMPPRETPTTFACEASELLGVVHQGAPNARTGVLVVVGGPQYRTGSHRQFVILARALARAGVPVMRFDYRGMGDSDDGADGALRTFEQVETDLRAAVDVFQQNAPSVQEVVLWGLCDGASAALLYSREDPRVAGLVLVNPWVHTQVAQAKVFLRHYYLQRFFSRSLWAKVLSGGFRPLRALRDLLRSVWLARARTGPGVPGTSTSFIERMLVGLRRFRGQILVVLSERDYTAKEFADLCRDNSNWTRAMEQPNVRLETLAGADHTFTTRADLDRLVELSCDWVSRQSLPERKRSAAAGP